MTWLNRLHATHVHARRVRRLAEIAAQWLPPAAEVLDVGCGDGQLGAIVARLRPDLTVRGVEVLPRADCHIPVSSFDGCTLPFADGRFHATLVVDVLHHANDPAQLLREIARVTRDAIVLKDHIRAGVAARATLRFMDVVGNRHHGVALPFNYLRHAEWSALFRELGLVVEAFDRCTRLYPFPASLVFGRGLHFCARLRPPPRSAILLSPQP